MSDPEFVFIVSELFKKCLVLSNVQTLAGKDEKDSLAWDGLGIGFQLEEDWEFQMSGIDNMGLVKMLL